MGLEYLQTWNYHVFTHHTDLTTSRIVTRRHSCRDSQSHELFSLHHELPPSGAGEVEYIPQARSDATFKACGRPFWVVRGRNRSPSAWGLFPHPTEATCFISHIAIQQRWHHLTLLFYRLTPAISFPCLCALPCLADLCPFPLNCKLLEGTPEVCPTPHPPVPTVPPSTQ